VSENQEYRLPTDFEGPHCKLRNSKKQQNLSIWPKVATFRYAFFLFQFMARVRSTRAMNWSGKNKVPKLTVGTEEKRLVRWISLGNWIELESTPRSQAVRTLVYGPLNQPITAHLVPERHNKGKDCSSSELKRQRQRQFGVIQGK